MGPLKLAGLLLALFIAAPLSASPAVEGWRPLIAEASQRFGIPERWIERVMRAESAGRTTFGGRPITSRAGAMGLMQVMPNTYRAMARAHGLGPDPHDPRDNILAGTAYLRAMYDRYGYPGLFAAYNAGPGRYSELLSRGRRLPAETIAYVAQVAEGGAARPMRQRTIALASPVTAPPPLFVLRAEPPPERAGPASPAPRSGTGSLFVVLSGAPRP